MRQRSPQSYVRRALSEPPAAGERAALLFLLGTAEWRAGQPDAIAHLEQALAAANDDPGTVIATCALLALAYNVSDQAERAVEVLERALAAVGDRDATLALTEPMGMIEPELLRDAGLALTLEAAIAVVGMMNERTAPAALRRAEALRARVNDAGRPTRLSARDIGLSRGADEPRRRGARAGGTGTGVRAVSTSARYLHCLDRRANGRSSATRRCSGCARTCSQARVAAARCERQSGSSCAERRRRATSGALADAEADATLGAGGRRRGSSHPRGKRA